MSLQTHTFEKETNGNWYVVLPDYPGPKADLLMVQGADTLLDILAQESWRHDVILSTEEFEGYDFILSFIKEDSGGAWYNAKSSLFDFDIWLCKVTKYVFGNLPEKIYCK